MKKLFSNPKLPMILLIAVVLMCIVGAIRYGNGDFDKTPEPVTNAEHGTGTAKGVLDGHTYTLTSIGMELRLPESFEVFSGKSLDTAIKGGASAFYRFAARNEEQVLTLSVPDVGGKGAQTYLNEARDKLKQERTVGDVEEMTISSFRFWTLGTKVIAQDGKEMAERTLIYEQDAKLFILGILCNSEQEDAVLQLLSEIIVKVEPQPATSGNE